MNDKNKWIIAGAIVLVIAIGIYYYNSRPAVNYDAFAKCLSEKNVRMYGAFWCSHCQAQKKEFGESWKYVNYTECAKADGNETDYCIKEGITGYPTWIFGDESRESGEVSFEKLSEKSGCKLP